MSEPAEKFGAFARATAVRRLRPSDSVRPTESSQPSGSLDASGIVQYASEIHDGWDIQGNANGGYLLAIAARAMSDAVGRPPLTLTAHYLRPGRAGPCEVGVETVRSGRRLATARATMTAEGKPILELLGTFGEQQPDDTPTYRRDAPLDLPPYADCIPTRTGDEGFGPPLMDRLACRVHPADVGFRHGNPTGDPLIRGWFDLADNEPIDVFGLLLASDAFAPPIFNSSIPLGWVPTVELTVHIRSVPAPGPLSAAFRNRFIHDGLVDEEGEVFDSTGALVAQCRQLALVPRPL